MSPLFFRRKPIPTTAYVFLLAHLRQILTCFILTCSSFKTKINQHAHRNSQLIKTEKKSNDDKTKENVNTSTD